MLSEARCREIFDVVRRASQADEVEVLLEATQSALTRFANNTIHQNVAEEGIHVSVRAQLDGRTARTTTNKTDADSLRRVAERAVESARWQPQNPDLLPLPGPQTYQSVDRYCEETAALTPEARAEAVGKVVARAQRNHLTAAGIFSSSATTAALLNSRGLFARHRETKAEFSVTFLDGGSGWAKGNFVSVRNLDVEELAARACDKALANRDPQELAPGRYTVILEPAAVLDLVGFLFYDFAGTAVLDKRSCFTDQVGKKVFGENISISDDVYHRWQAGAPWDGEGIPRQAVQLVERGVLKNLVYARHTAKKMNTQPTGHGFPLPNEYGEAPMNLVFAGGNSSLEEMISTTERGVLVTRLWYIREVDPYEKILTGMSRDGIYWVEGGQVKHAVRNLRFNQKLKEMLNQVELLGPAVRAAGEESFEMVVPAMRVANFHFTEVTKY
ncbi:MAG TPA: TldD/PmbA family protein [Candidatus Xenobia bacterium]|nr:TldD/PmbA family protein [Candidatus Xenobia bacterium]